MDLGLGKSPRSWRKGGKGPCANREKNRKLLRDSEKKAILTGGKKKDRRTKKANFGLPKERTA